jgi:hypothetical protein
LQFKGDGIMKRIIPVVISLLTAAFLCGCGPCEVHEFGMWETVQEPTCTVEGKQIRRCAECKTEEELPIPVSEHAMGEWIINREPSCTEKGLQSRTCQNCVYTEHEEIAEAKHDFENWTVAKMATCTENGLTVRNCKSCNFEETKSVAPVKHSYEKFVCTMCQVEQYTFCETGEAYEGPDGLSIKVNSFKKIEREGYFLYTLTYSVKNEQEDSAIDEGVFRLHMADGTYESQYGFFDKLFYKDGKNRTYEWKVLKNQEAVLLEYITWQMNMDFVKEIGQDTLHWIAP